MSYGLQSNDSLMQYYGFAEPDNPADAYVMTGLLKWLEQLQPAPQQRLDALNSAGAMRGCVLAVGGDALLQPAPQQRLDVLNSVGGCYGHQRE